MLVSSLSLLLHITNTLFLFAVAVAGINYKECVTKKRESWEDRKRLGLVRTAVAKSKRWTSKGGGGAAVSFPFASPLSENIAAPYVLGVWSCISSFFLFNFNLEG